MASSSGPDANFPKQKQTEFPGHEGHMNPKPEFIRSTYKGSQKLEGKVALITGGDSGIGRAVAVHFAREGADVAIVYLNEHDDANFTKQVVEGEGQKALVLAGDIGCANFCKEAVEKTVKELGRLDILVNNAAEQHVEPSLARMDMAVMERTFRTNIFSMFYLSQAALPHLREGSSIINSTSVVAYKGSPSLLDYSSTKGAIVAFTRSLSTQLVAKGIRVNAVAPGPIWTPMIPISFPEERTEKHGLQTPMQDAGQPSQVAPAYVFLASEDGSYFSGQVLHPNGGVVLNT